MSTKRRHRSRHSDFERDFSAYTRPKSNDYKPGVRRLGRIWSERFAYLTAGLRRFAGHWARVFDRRFGAQPSTKDHSHSISRRRRKRHGSHRHRLTEDLPGTDTPNMVAPEPGPGQTLVPASAPETSLEMPADFDRQVPTDDSATPRRRRRRSKSSHNRSEPSHPLSDSASTRSMGRARRRFLLVVAVLVGLAGLWLWNANRTEHQARELKRQIALSVEQGRWQQAAAWGGDYLRLRPNDSQARVERARNFGLAAESPEAQRQAVELYRATLLAVGDNTELRERLAAVLYQLELYTEAGEEAERLLKRSPENPLGWRIRAQVALRRAELGTGVGFVGAVELARRALALDHSNVELASEVAEVYRSRLPELSAAERERGAVDTLQALVTSNPTSARAWLARYRDAMRHGQGDADHDLDEALRCGPNDPEVLIAAGTRSTAREKYDQARRYFARAAELAPADFWVTLGLGDLERASGKMDSALELWEQIPTDRDDALAWETLTRRCELSRELRHTEATSRLLALLRDHLQRSRVQLSTDEIARRWNRFRELSATQ